MYYDVMNYDSISCTYSDCVFEALVIQHANPIFSALYYIILYYIFCEHFFVTPYLVNSTIFAEKNY